MLRVRLLFRLHLEMHYSTWKDDVETFKSYWLHKNTLGRLQEGRMGRAIAQAVSRQFHTAATLVQTRVWSCGIFVMEKSGAGVGFLRELRFVSPANLHSICFSTIIFTITRGWHNRPGAARSVPIASQTRIKKKGRILLTEQV
jgi:hypothetical protein